MTYPRQCPRCGLTEPSPEQLYSTTSSREGGTPSPWRPSEPGRLLDLRCGGCSGLFRWDYFGSRLVLALDSPAVPIDATRTGGEAAAVE